MLSENGVEEGKETTEHSGIKGITDTVKSLVDRLKETRPREAVTRIGEVAGQAKDQATNYMDHTTVRGMADDLASIIKRYPVRALMIGVAFGIWMTRRRAG